MNIKRILSFLLFLGLILGTAPFINNVYAYTVNITVAKDGTGNFKTVQAAIDSIPANNTIRKIIYVKNGVYKEKVRVNKPYVSIIGQDRVKTIITYNDHVDTSKSNAYNNETPTVIITGKDFTAENIKFENTAGHIERANAIKVSADRAAFYNCKIVGGQDTLFLTAEGKRAYFKSCYIEGDVDFIYGGMTAVFEKCEICSNSGGYITAACTPQTQKYGFMFSNCKLSATSGVAAGSVYLGRPWGPYASVLFKDTNMGAHIKGTGWDNWGNKANEATARFMEYNSYGSGWNAGTRVKWGKILSYEQVKPYTTAAYMNGTDGWNPTVKPYK